MARLGVVLLSALMLFGFGSTAQEAELTHLPIFASFVPNVQFAPLYVAIEEGLFAEAGFEVEIIHGDENVGVLQVAQK